MYFTGFRSKLKHYLRANSIRVTMSPRNLGEYIPVTKMHATLFCGKQNLFNQTVPDWGGGY